MRVFGEDGRRVGCCHEDNDGDEVLGLGDGRDEGEDDLAPSYGGSPSGESSSSGGYEQSPRSLRRWQWVASPPRPSEARGRVRLS